MINLIIGITFFAGAFILFKVNEDETAWLGLLWYVCAYIHFKWGYKFFAWLSLFIGTLDIIKGLLNIGGM